MKWLQECLICGFKATYAGSKKNESILRASCLPCGHQGMFTLKEVKEAPVRKIRVGQVYRKQGTKKRFIVIDKTLGGSWVFLPYRLRQSASRYKSYNQSIIPEAMVANTLVLLKDK